MSNYESIEAEIEDKTTQIQVLSAQVAAQQTRIKGLQSLVQKKQEVIRKQTDKSAVLEQNWSRQCENSILLNRQIAALKKQGSEYLRKLNALTINPQQKELQKPPSLSNQTQIEKTSCLQRQIEKLEKKCQDMENQLNKVKKQSQILVKNSSQSKKRYNKKILQGNSIDLVNQNTALTFRIETLERQFAKQRSLHKIKSSNMVKAISGMEKSLRQSRCEQPLGSSILNMSKSLSGILPKEVSYEDSEGFFMPSDEAQTMKSLKIICERMPTNEKLSFLNHLEFFVEQSMENMFESHRCQESDN